MGFTPPLNDDKKTAQLVKDGFLNSVYFCTNVHNKRFKCPPLKAASKNMSKKTCITNKDLHCQDLGERFGDCCWQRFPSSSHPLPMNDKGQNSVLSAGHDKQHFLTSGRVMVKSPGSGSGSGRVSGSVNQDSQRVYLTQSSSLLSTMQIISNNLSNF